jgi:hypothetical protein
VRLDTALPWLALCLTRVLAARLCARLLKQFGSPEDVFRAPLRQLEACDMPGATAQAVVNVKKEACKRAEKELAAIRAIPGCTLINWSEPEYPQTLLKIYDPPVLFYLRGDTQIPGSSDGGRACGSVSIRPVPFVPQDISCVQNLRSLFCLPGTLATCPCHRLQNCHRALAG